MRRCLSALWVVSIVCVVGQVGAQVPTDAGARQRYGAEQFKLGAKAIRSGDFSGAVVTFERAYEATDNPRLLYSVASAYALWPGHCVQSVQTYERYLKVASTCGSFCKGDAACVEKCDIRGLAKGRLSQLRPRCEGKVAFTSTPAGAAVTVGRTQRGVTPLDLVLLEGTYEVSAKWKTQPAMRKSVMVKTGAEAHVNFAFVVEPAVAAALAPAPPVMMDEGLRPWAWTAIGGGAALVVGGALHALTAGKVDDAESAERRADERAAVDDADRYYLMAQVGYGVGVAALGTSLMLWLADDDPAPSATSWRIVPAVDGVGLGLSF